MAWGVTFACPEGQGGLDGQARLMVGFEGTHTMPLGIRRHLADPAHYSISFTNGTSFEDLDTLTASVRDAGGLVSIAHSEETDLDWQLIADHDVTAMEIYNFHANFNVLFDSGQLDAIFEMEPFVGTLGEPGDPDLAALILLGHYPTPALDKWRRVSSVRPITPIAGSDVHENVILPGLCAFGLCEDLEEDFPNMVAALAEEGPLMMPDGERLDSYGRIFRWVQNRVRIDADADPVTAVEAALEAGRNVVVFELLGNPPGVDLLALGPDGVVLEIGETVMDDVGASLWARAPVAPTPGRTASWTDGSSAEITSTVYRSHEGETTPVGSTDVPGAWIEVPLAEPGAYHLEVMITPHHLAVAMGSAKDYASQTYRWVETGAIRVISAPNLEFP
jgi:hypothetical protein